MSCTSLLVCTGVIFFLHVFEVMSVDIEGSADSGLPKTWISKIFYEALVDFSGPSDVGSTACRQQTQLYARHLKNDSLWAAQMSDSWSRYPNGILVGTSHHMGVYDECVNVHQPIQGKYCIPSVKLGSSNGVDFTVGKPDQPQSNDHAWREILGTSDRNFLYLTLEHLELAFKKEAETHKMIVRFFKESNLVLFEFVDNDKQMHRNIVKFGICIPDSCTAADLQVTLQKEFDKHFLPHRVKAQVEVESILCSTDKDEYPYDTGYYLTSSLVGFIFLVCCLSTAYHLIIIIRDNNGENSEMPETLGSFSLIRNFKDLIQYNRNNELNIFHGLKVFTMLLVLFCHKFLYFVINPITYGIYLEKFYEDGSDFLLTAMNLIDPFFYIAGYLMYVMLIPQFNKPGTSCGYILMVIVYKYLRVLPSYVIMMMVTAFIIPHLGNGPFWASRIWPEADKCKNYWWANVLAVSNYIPVDNQCLISGWYVSCLLQFLVIGTTVVYVCVKHRKIGIYLIITLFIVSLATSFVTTYFNQAYGMIRIMYSFLENPSNSSEFSHYYRPFYHRGTPFYAGLLAGVVVEELKKRKIKLSKPVVYAGTLVVSTVCIWVQLYGVVFYETSRPYNAMEQSLYSVFSHCTWAVILFWITICHFTSGYGPIEKLLNNRLTVPLGRLSYTVYLVNIIVMMMIESKQRTAVTPSSNMLVDGWIIGSFRTYFVGTLLYLIIDAPFGLLIKLLLFGKTRGHVDGVGTAATPNETDAKTK